MKDEEKAVEASLSSFILPPSSFLLRLAFQTEQRLERAAHCVVAFGFEGFFLVLVRAARAHVSDALPHLFARSDEVFGERAAAVVAGGAAQGEQSSIAVRAEAEVARRVLADRRAAVRALRRALSQSAVAVVAGHRV